VSGYLQTPTASPPGTEMDTRLGGTRVGLDVVVKTEILTPTGN